MDQDLKTATVRSAEGGWKTSERPGDAEIRARRAELALTTSRYMTKAMIVVTALTVILWLFFRQYTQLLAGAGLMVLVIVGTGLYPTLDRRGKPTIGVYLMLISFLLMIATVGLLLPETKLALGIAYVFICIMAMQLLEGKHSYWLVGAALLAFVTDVLLISIRPLSWFTPLGPMAQLAVALSFCVFGLVAASIITRPIVTGQEDALRRSQQARLEVEKQAAAEQRQREHLQATIQNYVDYLEAVGDGDLTRQIEVDTDGYQEGDEPLLGLGHSLNWATARLQIMTSEIREAANNLNSAAAEILVATTQQASGASQQSAAISQTTTTVDELKTIAEQSIARAQEVTDTSQHTVRVSQAGQQAVQEAIASMVQIKARVESIAENILALSEQTQQIGEIIATVNDIAAQSNMLALNASVEAARAGEYGKGFAVVAAEVRSLAEQSRQATAQIKAILSDIQKATNATVMATEQGTKGVEEGERLAAQAGEAIGQLGAVVEESAQAAMQMVAGGRQQATGVEQIALAMQNINQATAQSIASTRQAEKAAQDLNNLASSLAEIVEQYRL